MNEKKPGKKSEKKAAGGMETDALLARRLEIIAHELRNPLAAVRSILQSTVEQLRESGGRLDEDDIEALELAYREQSRGLELVRAIRNLRRSSALPPERVDLNHVAAEAARILQVLAGKAHKDRIRLELAKEPLYFLGSHAETMQVLLNLGSNALDASSNGQPVTLETFRDTDGSVAVRCTDAGSGIAADAAARVFEPHFTTKAPGQGTGLGLPHSRELVERWAGTLVLEWTESGRGSAFQVKFPPAPDAK